MISKHWFTSGRWHYLLALFVVVGMEVWLLWTPNVDMDDPAFEILCALSCWLPAWFCADLLSNRDAGIAGGREWTPLQVLKRAAVRLIPCLLVLLLWCGTFTIRSLRAELAMPARPFVQNINNAADLGKVSFAWTTVFAASALAYGAAAGLCSALSRRRRRWLIAPAVVVGGSLVGYLLVATLVGLLNSGKPEPLLMNNSDPAHFWRMSITSPNYLVGANGALVTLGVLLKDQEAIWTRVVAVVGGGISLYCWTATAYFLIAGGLLSGGIAWISRNRHRRHPYTASKDGEERRPSEGRPDGPLPQVG